MRLINKMLLVGLVGFSGVAFSQTSNYFSKNITPLVSQKMAHALVGMTVADDKTGAILYDYDGSHYFTPASNQKIFTGAATLFYLGANYRYHTIMSAKANAIRNRQLNGNLYFAFNGDPSFKITDLQSMVATLKKDGVKTITGNVVLDTSRFLPPYYPPGWTIDSMNWYYSAPVTAVALNENAVYVNLKANARIGTRTPAQFAKYTEFFPPVTSATRAATQAEANGRCQLLIDMNEKNELSFAGCWPARKDNSTLGVAVKNPTLLAETIIKQRLLRDGIHLNGHFVVGATPHGLPPLVDHTSAPLPALVSYMLKQSNDFYAECFLKTLGAAYYHRGDFQNGVLAMQAILNHETGVDFKQTKMFDGSGESYYDLVSPQQLVKVLYKISHSGIGKLFYNALSISGRDGTLKYRMGQHGMLGKVHGKTGSLPVGSISTLSGYVTTARDRKLVFSIMLNHVMASNPRASMHMGRAFEDSIVGILYKYPVRH